MTYDERIASIEAHKSKALSDANSSGRGHAEVEALAGLTEAVLLVADMIRISNQNRGGR